MFHQTLQYLHPECFAVLDSNIHGAGEGLFFCGTAKKGNMMCGYSGKVFVNGKAHQLQGKIVHQSRCYTAALSNTPYVIDASYLLEATRSVKILVFFMQNSCINSLVVLIYHWDTR